MRKRSRKRNTGNELEEKQELNQKEMRIFKIFKEIA